MACRGNFLKTDLINYTDFVLNYLFFIFNTTFSGGGGGGGGQHSGIHFKTKFGQYSGKIVVNFG